MPDVFVSYSRQDSTFVTRLADAISSSGKQVWIDTAGIEDTEVFPFAIRSAIESSDAFLFVISPASVSSRFCEQEVDYALSLNKKLVPVLLTRVSDEVLPAPIRDRSWIPFETETEFEGSFDRVLNALDNDLEARRSHTRWLTKAIEWDGEAREASLLLRGNELRTAEQWLAGMSGRSDPVPTALQRDYLSASRQAAGRRSRILVAGSLLVTLVAVGLLVSALIARGQAVDEKVQASAQALATESENDLAIDPEASVILATRAVQEHATAQTMLALRESLDSSPLLASLPTVAAPTLCNGPTPAVAFLPGTHEVAENACSAGILLANAAQHGKVVRQLSTISSGTALTYNPAGTLLALGTIFGVSLLNSTSGAVEKVLLLQNTPGAVSFNRSGTMLGAAANGFGEQSALFDVATGHETLLGGVTNPDGYANNNSSLSFTPDGRLVVAAPGAGGVTPVFSTATGALVRTLDTGPVSLDNLPSFTATSPNPDVPLLAVAFNTDSGNGKVEIWSTRTWTEEFVLTAVEGVRYTGLAFSPDGTRLALAESNGSASVWSVPARREIVPLLGQTALITSIAFSSDGTEVATGSGDGTVRVWRAAGPELADLYVDGRIESVGLTPDRVVVASLDGQQLDTQHIEVTVWSRPSYREIGSGFVIPGSSAYDIVSVSPDGKYVADFVNSLNGSCGSPLCPSGLVSVYSVASGRPRGSYPVAGAEAIAWSPDDAGFAVAAQALEVVSLKTGLAAAFDVPGAEQCGTDGAPAFSSDGLMLAWATYCGNVAVFDLSGLTSGEPAGQLVSPPSFFVQGQPSGVAFNPGATQIAISTWSGNAGVYDPRTGQRDFSLATSSSGVTSVAYAPEGDYLVTTLLNGPAEVWAADGPLQGQLQRIDQSQAPLVITPAFSLGDFATGDTTGTVKIWVECPACGNARALISAARSQIVTQLTPIEQLAKQ
jgi:WD40 repeat protein